MNLVWKLLRQHISLGQFIGFFFANLIGMLIVLLSLQFYSDVLPAFTQDDGFIKNTYIVISKPIVMLNTLSDNDETGFTDDEIDEISDQSFARNVGRFTASRYRIYASLEMAGAGRIGTDLFFESVPDEFVDVKADDWKFEPDQEEVPIILPRTYLALYNFGFAQSQSLPKVAEGSVSLMSVNLRLRGENVEQYMRGRVVGFSTRLNTILVPESYMKWSNSIFAPEEEVPPTRLIVEVGNPADEKIATFMEEKGYELEDNQADAGRAAYMLRIIAGVVMAVGLLISALSFYILILSIFLLVQKNTTKLENLLLIGYSPARVSLPYQLLSIGLNALVLLIAAGLLMWLRDYYMLRLMVIAPDMEMPSLIPTFAVGAALFAIVSVFNAIAVRSKVMRIWHRKD